MSKKECRLDKGAELILTSLFDEGKKKGGGEKDERA